MEQSNTVKEEHDSWPVYNTDIIRVPHVRSDGWRALTAVTVPRTRAIIQLLSQGTGEEYRWRPGDPYYVAQPKECNENEDATIRHTE